MYYAQGYDQHRGFAYYPASDPSAGDIWFSPDLQYYHPGIDVGWPHPYQLILHEIGHALGLKHPFEGSPTLPQDVEDLRHSVMSYYGDYSFDPTTPMVLDVLAIQAMYGANHDTRSGDTVYTYDESRPYHEAIWDGGGNDTIRYVGSRAAMIDLNDGHSSRIGRELHSVEATSTNLIYDNIWIAYGASIENAQGGGGNDLLIGNSGNNRLDGSDGLDTAIYASAHSAYTVTADGGNFTLAGPDGTDSLANVERVQFGDGYNLALDIGGDGGMAYRLYQAAFHRAPDLPGLGYHIHDLDNGVALPVIAAHFIESPEFQATYGDVDNQQYITLLYRNVLHRDPEPAGMQFHLDEFAHGESRAGMLTHFSESPENQANVIGQIGQGMLFIPVG
jgi:serralysin